MKKRLFNLQLFADEATQATASTAENGEAVKTETAAAEPEKTTEDKKSVTAGQQSKEEEKVFTHAEFDRLFNQKYAELEKKKQKELDEAKKLEAMNATERANYENKKIQSQLDEVTKERDELKRQASIAEMTKTARKMLTDEGINVSDELLSVLVKEDAETTKAGIDNFVKVYKADVEAAVKERLRGEPLTVGTGKPAATLSEIDRRIKKYE